MFNNLIKCYKYENMRVLILIISLIILQISILCKTDDTIYNKTIMQLFTEEKKFNNSITLNTISFKLDNVSQINKIRNYTIDITVFNNFNNIFYYVLEDPYLCLITNLDNVQVRSNQIYLQGTENCIILFSPYNSTLRYNISIYYDIYDKINESGSGSDSNNIILSNGAITGLIISFVIFGANFIIIFYFLTLYLKKKYFIDINVNTNINTSDINNQPNKNYIDYSKENS